MRPIEQSRVYFEGWLTPELVTAIAERMAKAGFARPHEDTEGKE